MGHKRVVQEEFYQSFCCLHGHTAFLVVFLSHNLLEQECAPTVLLVFAAAPPVVALRLCWIDQEPSSMGHRRVVQEELYQNSFFLP